jgi:hypothetical protein
MDVHFCQHMSIVLEAIVTRAEHEGAVLGAGEARTEPYMKYGEGALEPVTT